MRTIRVMFKEAVLPTFKHLLAQHHVTEELILSKLTASNGADVSTQTINSSVFICQAVRA